MMVCNPNKVRFIPCKWEEIGQSVESYIKANQIIVESFWEDHIFESKHYKMMFDDDFVGFFAIHGGSTIMLFYVAEKFGSISQELFARVKKYESVTNAMVATGDEFFMSHCLDSFTRIEKQAYVSIYTANEIADKMIQPVELRLADVNSEKDLDTFKLSGDFLDGEVENIKNGLDVLKIYIVELRGETVGFGVIQYGRVVSDIASIGMYVCEEYRRQGFAASILQRLKHISQEHGCRVFSGCWYYNHNSKKSMESAGAYSKTRLVRFYF